MVAGTANSPSVAECALFAMLAQARENPEMHVKTATMTQRPLVIPLTAARAADRPRPAEPPFPPPPGSDRPRPDRARGPAPKSPVYVAIGPAQGPGSSSSWPWPEDPHHRQLPCAIADPQALRQGRWPSPRLAHRQQHPVDYGLIQGGLQGIGALPRSPTSPPTQTGLKHTDGAVSIARTAPGTATSDFFICIGHARPILDANPAAQTATIFDFAAFGRVVQGMDIGREDPGPARAQQAINPVMKDQILDPAGADHPRPARIPAPTGPDVTAPPAPPPPPASPPPAVSALRALFARHFFPPK